MKMKSWRAASAAGLALVAFGVTACGSSGSAQIDEQVQREDAKSACHKFVKDRLKSPSSAKFSEEDYTGTDGVYTFKGAVDSQNSFGAMIRATWTCDVQSSGDEWRGSADINEAD